MILHIVKAFGCTQPKLFVCVWVGWRVCFTDKYDALQQYNAEDQENITVLFSSVWLASINHNALAHNRYKTMQIQNKPNANIFRSI